MIKTKQSGNRDTHDVLHIKDQIIKDETGMSQSR